MNFPFTLLLLALGFAAAAPHATRYNYTLPLPLDLIKRDPCDGIDSEPLINHEYREPECPAKKHGTYYHYIREAPFPRSECHYPISCEITESHTTTTGWSTSVTAKMGKAYKLGISGGYSKSQSDAHGRSWKFEPQPGECGYFTFVGIMKTTCGTYTEGRVTYVNHAWQCNFPKTTVNQCADQLWMRQGSSEPEGVVVFVRTDCVTREPLGPEFQDPVYNQPDVALPRSALDALQQSWVTNTCTADPRDGGYHFDIHGRGFADSAIGANGGKLRDALNQCGGGGGDVSGWTFSWTPTDGTYDWAASGTVPGESKSCIGKAIMSHGGATADQCT
ncbi:hypothetical protein F5X96DRAFT_690899 [Biscogniauxia mediterranea]|nr:hypothetical protein F5X96DRAFT_690899 [Biscogniauxia mediterranea]